MSYQLDQLKQQLAQLQEQHQRISTEIELEKQARVELQAESLLAPHVKQPGQLARLLQAEGTLVEQAGELQLKTAEGTVPLEQGLSTILKTPDYQHFQLTTPADTEPPAGPLLQGGQRTPSDKEIRQALSNPGNSALFAELEHLMQPAPPATQQELPNDAELAKILGDPTKAQQFYAQLESGGE